MQTGVVTSETLSQVLRSLSQKRQQGVLEIAQGDEKIQVVLYAGRIVDIWRGNAIQLELFYSILRRTGLVSELSGSKGHTYKALYKNLVEHDPPLSHLSESIFKCLVKHWVLKGLFSLSLNQGAYYSFKPQVIEYDKDFCPSVSVGQFLLDLVAIETEGERFSAVFSGDPFIRLSESFSEPESEEEEIVELIVNRGLRLHELENSGLLSKYHLIETLLSMYERGDLEFEGDGSSATRAIEISDLAISLESSIDQTFAAEPADPESCLLNKPVGKPAKVKSAVVPVVGELKSGRDSFSLQWLNARILRNPVVPQIISALILLCGLLAPIFFWADLWAGFTLP